MSIEVTLNGNKSLLGAWETPPTQERTVGYFIERAKLLLQQDKVEAAMDIIEQCCDHHKDLSEWQSHDLNEMTAKIIDVAETLLSPEEFLRLKRKKPSAVVLTDLEPESKTFRHPINLRPVA